MTPCTWMEEYFFWAVEDKLINGYLSKSYSICLKRKYLFLLARFWVPFFCGQNNRLAYIHKGKFDEINKHVRNYSKRVSPYLRQITACETKLDIVNEKQLNSSVAEEVLTKIQKENKGEISFLIALLFCLGKIRHYDDIQV